MRILPVLILGVVAGCGGNDAVWSSSVRQLVLRSSGGFPSPSQPTPECPSERVEYTLVVVGRSLSALRCAPDSTAPYPLRRTTASRMLSATEYDGLVQTLEALRVVSDDTCGADKPTVTVIVTTPSGTTEYADSFYSCVEHDGRPTIDTNALDAAALAFHQLAFPDP